MYWEGVAYGWCDRIFSRKIHKHQYHKERVAQMNGDFLLMVGFNFEPPFVLLMVYEVKDPNTILQVMILPPFCYFYC
jgi:hypothetical protein